MRRDDGVELLRAEVGLFERRHNNTQAELFFYKSRTLGIEIGSHHLRTVFLQTPEQCSIAGAKFEYLIAGPNVAAQKLHAAIGSRYHAVMARLDRGLGEPAAVERPA